MEVAHRVSPFIMLQWEWVSPLQTILVWYILLKMPSKLPVPPPLFFFTTFWTGYTVRVGQTKARRPSLPINVYRTWTSCKINVTKLPLVLEFSIKVKSDFRGRFCWQRRTYCSESGTWYLLQSLVWLGVEVWYSGRGNVKISLLL